MLTSTMTRVSANTCDTVNATIQRQTQDNIRRYGSAGPQAIERRLRELSEEWDIERCLESMAPALSLAGLALGITGNKKWLAIPVIVQAFFLQHALQGWCPPIPILRRLGVRTQTEIDEERYALKALRGDFRKIGGHGRRPEQDAAAAAQQ